MIAVLVPSPARWQRLVAAIGDGRALRRCGDWSAVALACEHEAVELIIADLYADGKLDLENVRVLRRRFPRVPIVAYVSEAPGRARDLFDAGRLGVESLVLADRDDAPESLRAMVEQAEARGVAALMRRHLAPLDPFLRDTVMIAVTRLHEHLTPDTLARALGVSRRALSRHLQDSGFPPPQQLLGWARLIFAAHMLETRTRSADSAAQALGYASGSAFRNICRRYVGATPQEIRSRGGARFVLDAMLARSRSGASATPGNSDDKR